MKPSPEILLLSWFPVPNPVRWFVRLPLLLEEGLHGAEAGIGERSAEAFGSVATLVEMMLVE